MRDGASGSTVSEHGSTVGQRDHDLDAAERIYRLLKGKRPIHVAILKKNPRIRAAQVSSRFQIGGFDGNPHERERDFAHLNLSGVPLTLIVAPFGLVTRQNSTFSAN